MVIGKEKKSKKVNKESQTKLELNFLKPVKLQLTFMSVHTHITLYI